jgi:hypothetical protein
MVGTVGIWLSLAIILAFGVFRANWNGSAPMLVMLLIVFALCLAATVSTAFIWKGQHLSSPPPPSTGDRPGT